MGTSLCLQLNWEVQKEIYFPLSYCEVAECVKFKMTTVAAVFPRPPMFPLYFVPPCCCFDCLTAAAAGSRNESKSRKRAHRLDFPPGAAGGKNDTNYVATSS